MRPGLRGNQSARDRFAVCGADGKDTVFAAELAHPQTIALEVAVAGMAQTSRMSVHHAQYAQAAIVLPDDPAGQGLGAGIKANMSYTCAALGAGGQRPQHPAFIR